MSQSLLEKLHLKPEYSVAILNLPKELQNNLQLIQKSDTSLLGAYNFILSFYSKKDDLEKEIIQLKEALLPHGLLWVAYPKNKALQTDLHRDILHTLMKSYQLDGVSLISLSDTWSAMRFKKI